MFVRRADLEAILAFVVDIGELGVERPYRAQLLTRLADLIPCADLTYQEVDLPTQRTTAVVWTDGDGELDEGEDALYWSLGPCPITRYRISTGDHSAVRMSDVIDWHRYLDQPFYREYYLPARVEHMVDLGMPSAAGQLRSYFLFRGTGERDFSDRDRTVLEMLRPHLVRLELAAALRHQLSEALHVQDGDGEPAPSGRLTAREHEIVQLVAQGKTNAEIAVELWVAPSTVKKHLENVYVKLGVGRRAAAATYARPIR